MNVYSEFYACGPRCIQKLFKSHIRQPESVRGHSVMDVKHRAFNLLMSHTWVGGKNLLTAIKLVSADWTILKEENYLFSWGWVSYHKTTALKDSADSVFLRPLFLFQPKRYTIHILPLAAEASLPANSIVASSPVTPSMGSCLLWIFLAPCLFLLIQPPWLHHHRAFACLHCLGHNDFL